MRSTLLSAAAVALAAAQLGAAQTFTSCDPTKKSCPADKALGRSVTVDFTKGANSEFNLADGTKLTYDGSNGALFTINKETDAPTITSNWYIFFGKVDVVMKAAPGQGIVSSFVMESDDLDEIDWEWLGGDLTQVETNYFGKGNTTTYDRATYVSVASPQDTFHTYTIDWTAEAIKWSIDGNVIRTLAYGDANGGKTYPQTPMQVKMGNWVGGSSTAPQGTVQWAGGLADFSKAPFVMQVKSVTIQDYSSGGSEYIYSDMSGTWQSIKTDSGSPGSSSGSSSSSPSGTSTSASASAKSSSMASTAVKSTASSSTFSTATTVPVASGGGLGAGAVTASVSSNSSFATGAITSPTSTGAAASSKPTGNTSATLKFGSSYGMAVLALGLGYLIL